MNYGYDFYEGKQSFVYAVQKGDTIKSIGELFSAPEGRLIADNALTREPLKGEWLIINREHGIKYTAEPLDTLRSVAEKFGVNAERLAEINGITELIPTQTIYVHE